MNTFLLCLSLLCQGFTFRDVGFVGALGGSGTSSPGGGGGGESAPPAPSFFWELDEASGDRVDSVASLAMVPNGSGVGVGTGLIGDAFKNHIPVGSPETTSRIRVHLSTSLATTGGSISLAFWHKGTSGTAPVMDFEVYDSSDTLKAAFGWSRKVGAPTQWRVSAFNNTDPFPEALIDSIPDNVSDGNWHLIVMVWDSSSGKVKYSEDGGAYTLSNDSVTLDSDVKGSLFVRNADADEYRIDLWALWLNHALTADEVTWMYNDGAGRTYADY